MKIKLCEYRNHICQVVEEYGDNDVDLRLLAEPLVNGGLAECDCAREYFNMVKVYPEDIVCTEITDMTAATGDTGNE